jgi:phospho-N-acetylmuramoyl-pentapeptide-transferase
MLFETRIVLAIVVACLIVLLTAPTVIRLLKRICPERIASDSETLNTLHAGKQGTPTLGGLLVLGAALTAVLGFAELASVAVLLPCLVGGCLMLLGLRDDWVKSNTQSHGVTPRQKLVVQACTGAFAGAVLFAVMPQHASPHWLIRLIGSEWLPGGILFVVWSIAVVTFASNAVNLTDGLDGLATGTTAIALIPMILAAVVAARIGNANGSLSGFAGDFGESAVVLAALLGAVAGFLWFNCHPAKVFLGDTGALPIGGILATHALATGTEVLLLVAGGVFLVETLSVVLQVASFRIRGKRILRCSPLHNHFVFRGDAESSIVVRFWLVGSLLALVTIWYVSAIV